MISDFLTPGVGEPLFEADIPVLTIANVLPKGRNSETAFESQ